MIRSTQKIVALLPVFDAAPTERRFAGMSVVAHTLARLRQCEQLDAIAVLHDASLPDHAAAVLQSLADDRVRIVKTSTPLADAGRRKRLAARAFAPTAWRGGLGGATCYDELLAADAMHEALQTLGATAGLLAGPDWPLIDPALCDAVIERHTLEPQRLTLTFTQAAVGLCGCVVARSLMHELAQKQATIGSVLDYSVAQPQADPIAKDLCVQVEPAVRDAGLRAVCDGGRDEPLLRSLEQDDDLLARSAAELAQRFAVEAARTPPSPAHVTLELTPRRLVHGPIVPQHHVAIDRPEMDRATAERLIEQIAAMGDATLTLGGLGDALLHPDWHALVAAAKAAGISAVHVETDLLLETDTLDQLLASEIDVLSVRLNADTAATYQQLMGVDGFARVLANIQYLLNQQRAAAAANNGGTLETQRKRWGGWGGWIVPRLLKTAANVSELEAFFDRWTHFCGHAVIESPTTGCGRAPDLAVIDMAGPRRRPCRQLRNRLSILSNGRAALCDQDWLGNGLTDGNANPAAAWQALDEIRHLHDADRAAEHSLCRQCTQWHRP